MSESVLFEQVSDTALYETRVAGGTGWAAYVLPQGSVPPFPATVTIEESLKQYSGYYIFALDRPDVVSTDPSSFLSQVYAYQANSFPNNRAVFWLQRSSPLIFGEFGEFGFQFFNNPIIGTFPLASDMNANIGAQVNFAVLTGLSLLPDESGNGIALSGQSLDPLLRFQKGESNLGISLMNGTSNRALIPISGPNTGCLVVSGSMAPAVTFRPDGIELGISFFYRDASAGGQRIHYPGFPTDSLPASLTFTGLVDPSDPLNTRISSSLLQEGRLRTGFVITQAPSLISNFRTPEGRVLSLIPTGSDGTTILMAGSFAFASASSVKDSDPFQSNAYLTLAGRFGLSVAGEDAGKAQEFLCGLFGSERITFTTYDSAAGSNDNLFFLLSQPTFASVFPFDTANLDNPESGGVRKLLSDDYLSSWATLFSGGNAVEYRAEPEASPLYGSAGMIVAGSKNTVSILPSAPPRMPLPQGAQHTFPLVPYAQALSSPPEIGSRLTQFESQILAPTRKNIISSGATATFNLRTAAMLGHAVVAGQYATTPQGLIALTDSNSGAYLNVLLAQSVDREQQPLPFAFDAPTLRLQDALQTNQLFMVAVNDRYFNAPPATFQNTIFMADWMMRAQIGQGATPTSYRNVMIMKFCSGTLQERVKNPNRWTNPADFSLVAGSDLGTASIAYTGLSQWLQDYIAAGISMAEGPSADYYRNFKTIVTDPSWNGVIVLQADLTSDDLPPQIQGLAAGIDFTQFVAHHFGFTASRVVVEPTSGVISMDGNSSLFGLIDYQNPAYAANLQAGIDPETPIPVVTSDDFNFTVLRLQSLFQNARLVRFNSNVQFTVQRLFGSNVVKAYKDGVPMPATGVVLDGSYVDQNGKASYIFEQSHTTTLILDSNVLLATALNRVQFNTLGTRDQGATTASQFLIWGAFDFVQLSVSQDGDKKLFDVLSFGSPPDAPPSSLGVGLSFSNLAIEMTFPTATPNVQSFRLNTDNLAWDTPNSVAREQSLFKGFGLQLKSFINASGDSQPADFGFLSVSSNLSLKLLGKPWYGVVYQVTLGGPGTLASAVGFTSNMLLAWSPVTKTSDQQWAVFTGLSLPGATPGAKLFSLQGVFKVSVGNISLLRQPVPGSSPLQEFYCLRLDDIALKIFGIVKLPPDATIQFFLFGDPSNTGSLAWYAAYVAEQQSTGANAVLLPVDSKPQLQEGLAQ